ncbi:MAG: NAD-dependent epimerase/dehydratase family protein [Planctomycetota bacterium]|nr:NAD-dependent epimerase/dehydratase family protein [Planctomycetota bacterium]
MQAFVTGGTGFLGSSVVRKLLDRGAKVKALARASSDLSNIEGLDLELVQGDLTDAASWKSALEGCDSVFHVAADYRLWVPDPDRMFEINVEGTRQVLEAAIENRVKKVVYTSTVGALAYPEEGEVSNEESEPSHEDMVGPYKQSKFEAELVARNFAADGHPIVIVLPSTPIGPGDIKPTPTGKVIVDCLNGKMPGYVNTGLNLIDVRDCAEGHILAAEKGQPGGRYILGNRNITLKQMLEIVSSYAGIKPPRLQIPYAIAYAYALLDTFVADYITKKPPVAPVVGVKLASHYMYFDASKAVDELGLSQNPLEDALHDAVDWFREKGYVKNG